MIFYLLFSGVQLLPIAAYFTATFRFIIPIGEMKMISILSPVSDVVDTTTLELKEEIAT